MSCRSLKCRGVVSAGGGRRGRAGWGCRVAVGVRGAGGDPNLLLLIAEVRTLPTGHSASCRTAPLEAPLHRGTAVALRNDTDHRPRVPRHLRWYGGTSQARNGYNTQSPIHNSVIPTSWSPRPQLHALPTPVLHPPSFVFSFLLRVDPSGVILHILLPRVLAQAAPSKGPPSASVCCPVIRG